jgi:hypothetical protein
MHATGTTATSDLSGLGRSRLDVTASLTVRVSPSLFVSGAAGRTISSLDQNGATLLASANISYTFSRARAQP